MTDRPHRHSSRDSSRWSRREFLRKSSLIAAAPTIPAFLSAAANARASFDDRILVVLELNGGNDGLNTVVPYREDRYYAARPELAIPADRVLKLNDELGFHPSMRGAMSLAEKGWLSVVQGVGYPNPDRSHFRSQKIWHTGKMKPGRRSEETGWIGRSLDPEPRRRGSDAVYVGEARPSLSLRGRRLVTSTLLYPEDLELATPVDPRDALADVAGPSANGDRIDLGAFVHRNVVDAYRSAAELRDALSGSTSDVSYQADPIAIRLQRIAGMIRAGFGARVYYATHAGYDTHNRQAPVHERLLGELSGGLDAFYRDLSAAGLAERVVTLAFSEFGRPIKSNGSHGTDHGTAAPVFLAGPAVRGPVFGEHPDFGDLDEYGDFKSPIDFRSVYATALDWIGVEADFIEGPFKRLPVIRT